MISCNHPGDRRDPSHLSCSSVFWSVVSYSTVVIPHRTASALLTSSLSSCSTHASSQTARHHTPRHRVNLLFSSVYATASASVLTWTASLGCATARRTPFFDSIAAACSAFAYSFLWQCYRRPGRSLSGYAHFPFASGERSARRIPSSEVSAG